MFNGHELEKCKNLPFLIGNLAILEIQDRFKNYYFQKSTKKNDEQIFTFVSFKISPILHTIFCDPEPENLTEVWTHLQKQRQCAPVETHPISVSAAISLLGTLRFR